MAKVLLKFYPLVSLFNSVYEKRMHHKGNNTFVRFIANAARQAYKRITRFGTSAACLITPLFLTNYFLEVFALRNTVLRAILSFIAVWEKGRSI